MGYTVRPMHILFRPCDLILNKRNDRQRSPTAIMQTNSSKRMRVRINVVGVVLSINDRPKRVSGRGLCETFTKTNFAPGTPTAVDRPRKTMQARCDDVDNGWIIHVRS